MPSLSEGKPYLVEGRNLVLIPDTDDYRPWVPDDATFVTLHGLPLWACKHTPELNNLLFEIGEHIPAPIFFEDYDWANIEIFAEQAQMAGLISARRRCYNLSEMGCGKTIGALLAIDYLIEKGHIERACIIAPLSILWDVWQHEIMMRFPRLRPVVLHGSYDKRTKLLHQRSWNVAIINHDGIGVIHDELLRCNFGCIIVDEAASFRDSRTRKFKLMQRLLKEVPFAGALTGSPTPNAPSDAYGLAKLFTPERITMGFRSFRQTLEVEVHPNRWLPKPSASTKVFNLLQPAVRFKRSEIISLKEFSSQTRRVGLSTMQKEAMAQLKKEAIVRFEEGDVEGRNAVTLIGKLLQICSGAVYTTDKAVVDLKAQPRYDMVRSVLDEAEGKVIVLAPYIHCTELLHSNLRKDYSVAVVNGSVPAKERVEIFRSFGDKRDPMRVLIGHPKVLAHGLNLTAANVVVWFAPIYSREIYEQANARITRLGQTREQLILHLSSGREEDAVYAALEKKGTMQDVILAMFEQSN